MSLENMNLFWFLGAIVLISFGISLVTLRVVISRFIKSGLMGRDVQKPGEPQVADMGGIAIVAGFGASILIMVGIHTFYQPIAKLELVPLFAVLNTVILIALVGLLDDLIEVGQRYKAGIPVLAALPLMAIQSGDSVMNLPFLGFTDLGLIYPLVLVPIGVTGAANAINMLAGFNGVEAGMGAVSFLALAVIALSLGEVTASVMLLAALGGTVAFLWFNWYPAKVFIGDVGTLSIGAILASAVILGDFELAGIILVLPHAVDFIFKATSGFPKTFGVLQDGKLHCPLDKPAGLGQWIMKITHGIHERTLTLTLIALEAILGLWAIFLYARF